MVKGKYSKIEELPLDSYDFLKELSRNLDIKLYKRISNVRSGSIRISNDMSVTITIPIRSDDRYLAKLINEKSVWIKNTLKKVYAKNSTKIKVGVDEVLFLGDIYKFQRVVGMKGNIMRDDVKKIIYSSIDLNDKIKLLKYYKDEAKITLINRVNLIAKRFDFKVKEIRIRRTRSRYGSCTRDGVITMSEQLIISPLYVIDMVIAHELAHLKVMNHSKEFYHELAKICPDYKEADSWLKLYMPTEFPPKLK